MQIESLLGIILQQFFKFLGFSNNSVELLSFWLIRRLGGDVAKEKVSVAADGDWSRNVSSNLFLC